MRMRFAAQSFASFDPRLIIAGQLCQYARSKGHIRDFQNESLGFPATSWQWIDKVNADTGIH